MLGQYLIAKCSLRVENLDLLSLQIDRKPRSIVVLRSMGPRFMIKDLYLDKLFLPAGREPEVRYDGLIWSTAVCQLKAVDLNRSDRHYRVRANGFLRSQGSPASCKYMPAWVLG
jgi:hypothetical protein